jgi:hypothetical protein
VFNTGASAFGQTIKSLYKAASPDAYAFYNDETPSMMRSASHAHMKVNYDEKPKKAFFFFFFFFSVTNEHQSDNRVFWRLKAIKDFG